MFVYNERKPLPDSRVWRKLNWERAQKHRARACGRCSRGQDVPGVGARSTGWEWPSHAWMPPAGGGERMVIGFVRPLSGSAGSWSSPLAGESRLYL